jgi:biotin transport system substrate-specific component
MITWEVVTVGAGLGWRRGAASMLLYLVAGMAGVPWFQDGKSGWLV